jgi:methionyl-tRNA formyltransferase
VARGDGRLDWRRPAAELERRVRALDPWPGAFFTFRDEAIRVLAATAFAEPATAAAGTVLDDRLTIACGVGTLRPLRLQRPGRAAIDAEAVLRGYAIAPGTRLPCPATS